MQQKQVNFTDSVVLDVLKTSQYHRAIDISNDQEKTIT